MHFLPIYLKIAQFGWSLAGRIWRAVVAGVVIGGRLADTHRVDEPLRNNGRILPSLLRSRYSLQGGSDSSRSSITQIAFAMSTEWETRQQRVDVQSRKSFHPSTDPPWTPSSNDASLPSQGLMRRFFLHFPPELWPLINRNRLLNLCFGNVSAPPCPLTRRSQPLPLPIATEGALNGQTDICRRRPIRTHVTWPSLLGRVFLARSAQALLQTAARITITLS